MFARLYASDFFFVSRALYNMDSLWHLLPPARSTPAAPQSGGGAYFDVSPSGPESMKGSRIKHGGAEARFFDRYATLEAINRVKQ